MGIEDKAIESIIEAHSETVNGLKADRDKYKEQAQRVPDLQKQLEEAEAASGSGDEWQQKYEAERKAFEDFKAQVETEKAEADKAKAYRGMLTAAGIDPKRIDAIMRVTDLSQVEIEDGKLKDTEKLQESAKQEWADFIVKTKTQGADPATPPKGDGGVEGADPEIAKRMQERHERLYGKPTKEE
jgi:phenylalanyl-tRNA synthetase alpha subunit